MTELKSQRPYAIATAGTPVQLSYNYRTSEFTYRFRTPSTSAAVDRELAKAATDELPSTAQITEIFLPRRVYKQELTKYLLSPGGCIRFDWEAQRAYVWFVGTPSLQDRPERRVEFWIGVREANHRRWWQTLLLITVWVLTIALAMWVQKLV